MASDLFFSFIYYKKNTRKIQETNHIRVCQSDILFETQHPAPIIKYLTHASNKMYGN